MPDVTRMCWVQAIGKTRAVAKTTSPKWNETIEATARHARMLEFLVLSKVGALKLSGGRVASPHRS